MIIATILLDEQDKYVYADDTLPARTTWDKKLLGTFINRQKVSKQGYDMLPPSLQKTVEQAKFFEEPYPITVPEIDALADILVVTRSTSRSLAGKIFRMDKFEPVLKSQGIEIWKRKTDDTVG